MTESGIVETEEDDPILPRRESLRPKTPQERRPSLLPSPSNSLLDTTTKAPDNTSQAVSNEDTEQMFKEFHKSQRKKSTKISLDDAKSKLKNFRSFTINFI